MRISLRELCYKHTINATQQTQQSLRNTIEFKGIYGNAANTAATQKWNTRLYMATQQTQQLLRNGIQRCIWQRSKHSSHSETEFKGVYGNAANPAVTQKWYTTVYMATQQT